MCLIRNAIFDSKLRIHIRANVAESKMTYDHANNSKTMNTIRPPTDLVNTSVPVFIRVMPTHDLNAILYPPSSENTVGCIAV